MQAPFSAVVLAMGWLIASGSYAYAETIVGIETDPLLADLRAGNAVSQADLSALMLVDLGTLTRAQLSALLEILRELESGNPDVGPKLTAVIDRIAFLEAVAEDLPIPASPV